MTGNNKPLARLKAGSVVCAVWENEVQVGGKTKTLLKATVERRYKAEDGWKSSGSYGRSEIPLVRHVLQQAFELMLQERSREANGIDEEAVL